MADAVVRPHIRPIDGLGMGVPVRSDAWDEFARSSWVAICCPKSDCQAAQTSGKDMGGPVVDALTKPMDKFRRESSLYVIGSEV